jgi:hypothetical protein
MNQESRRAAAKRLILSTPAPEPPLTFALLREATLRAKAAAFNICGTATGRAYAQNLTVEAEHERHVRFAHIDWAAGQDQSAAHVVFVKDLSEVERFILERVVAETGVRLAEEWGRRMVQDVLQQTIQSA